MLEFWRNTRQQIKAIVTNGWRFFGELHRRFRLVNRIKELD